MIMFEGICRFLQFVNRTEDCSAEDDKFQRRIICSDVCTSVVMLKSQIVASEAQKIRMSSYKSECVHNESLFVANFFDFLFFFRNLQW